jgi:HSP20 family protein|tara:strand:- start:62 stop:487 length:426 start_codon:yes stop_codon:yes gene_type:complete
MTSLIKHNDLFNDIFPTWTNWDRFDNYLMNNDPWTTSVGHRPTNKYRWNETDNSYTLDIVMPGMTKKDIDLTFKDGTLSIKCKKEVSDSDSQFYGVKTDQSFRNFPRGVNADKVTAEMKEGILYIVLPKKEPNKGKTIDIK